MSKIIMVTIGVVALLWVYFFICRKALHVYLGKPVSKEVILKKIEYLYQNIDTLPKIELYCRLIWIRELLEHRLRYYTIVNKDDYGKKAKSINNDEFPEEWDKCVDYLWQTFDRRENGPYRDIDLQTMKLIAKDAYDFLKN